jgi:hypothetical protein
MLGFVVNFSLDDFTDSVSDTLGLRKSASNLGVTDDEDVVDSGVEDVLLVVLQGDDGNVTHLLDDGLDGTDSAQVVTSSNQSLVTSGELEVLLDGAALEVVLNGVTDLDAWVRVSQSSGIVGNEVWNLVGADLDLHDLAELLVGFLVLDSEQGESSLLIVEHSEEVATLWNAENVCN